MALVAPILPRFVLINLAHRAMVTTNLLAGWFGKDPAETYTTYGPGFHVSFPWEDREEENNVSLELITEPFESVVQVKDGNIRLRGSYRFRASIRHLPNFIGIDISTLAEGVNDLVVSRVVTELAPKSTTEVLGKGVDDLNDFLSALFRDPDTENVRDVFNLFLENFGVFMSDVTVAEILPSAEQMKTRNALDEAEVIARGTAIILGYGKYKDPVGQMRRNLKNPDHPLTTADINKARDRFLASSENATMDINVHEVSGLDGLGAGMNAIVKAFGGKRGGGSRRPKKPESNTNGGES